MPISEVMNIDCMEYMAGLPDAFFDLAITDPPYGINAPNMQMGNNAPSRNGKSSVAVRLKKGRLNQGAGKLKGTLLQEHIGWDYERPPVEYFNELRRISKNQIVFGGNYFTDMLPASRCWLCWDKLQPWENFSQFELAWTSFDSPAQMFNYSNSGGINREEKIHPTQKPIALYVWALGKFGEAGNKIFDSHLGSGSSRIAAYKLGYDFTATELDKDYFDAQEKRFKQAINEPLFQTQPTATQSKLL